MVLSGLGTIGCSPANEKEKPTTKFASDGTFSASPVFPEGTISVPQNAGPAAKCVAAFFQDWKRRQYEAMHGRLVDAGPIDAFRDALTRTPVRWKSAEILQETGDEGDRRVSFSLEVTDLVSVMAAYVFNYAPTSPIRGVASQANPFPEKPDSLGIETFCTVKQTSRVVGPDTDCKIRFGQDGSDKILSYFIDAAERTYDRQASSVEGGMYFLNMSRVMVQLSEPIGMTEVGTETMVKEINQKAELAARHFRKSGRTKSTIAAQAATPSRREDRREAAVSALSGGRK